MTIPSSVSLRRQPPVSKNNTPIQSYPKTRKRRKRRKARRLSIILLSLTLGLVLMAVLVRYLLASFSSLFLLLLMPSTGRVSYYYSAVQKAEFYGLPQRKLNSGRAKNNMSPTFWNQLTTNATCDDQGAVEFLEVREIQRLQLPRAILIGVQKGGTTALFQYLDQHPAVERTKKELYFLDEDLDVLLGHATAAKNGNAKIPRQVGRNLYHQKMRDGIVEARMLEKQAHRHKEQLRLKLKAQDRKVPLADLAADQLQQQQQQVRSRRLQQQQQQQQQQQTENLPNVLQRKENRKMHRNDLDDGFSQSHHGPPPNEFQPQKRTNTTIISNKFVMDLTPNYIFHSDRVPNRIKCLVPWVRLMVLMRNPVPRAISQYNMKLQMVLPKQRNQYGNPIPSLDEYIENDLNVLFDVGVLQDWTVVDFDTYWASKDCWLAWNRYVRYGLNAPVGMGLYALQLKPYLDMLLEIHHPADDFTATDNNQVLSEYFLAIDSQDLQLETDKTYQEVLKFLGLSPFSLTEYARVNKANNKSNEKDHHLHQQHAHHQTRLSPAIQKRMEEAIAPYNRKLGDLLGEEWRNKWSSSLPPTSVS
ncbi:MAG: hypothetical protein SGBAC_011031 [Bacillariaceae sp.]